MDANGRLLECKIKAADAAVMLRDDLQELHAKCVLVSEEIVFMAMLEQVATIANTLERIKDEAINDDDLGDES